jgi:hypothetical protein
LRQRYAFQLMRLHFYRRNWDDVLVFYQANRDALEAPSANLRWRARYYLAGAFRRNKDLAHANLWLARIFAGAPALASGAANDFQPMQQSDWQQTLALVESPQEKILLWRLAGLKFDPLVAIDAIAKLDPKSDQLGLLAVREINRVEASSGDLRALQKRAERLADKPQTKRRWLFNLVAGHAAALRGDLKTARQRIASCLAEKASDPLVVTQAHASLAIALSAKWKGHTPEAETELAAEMKAIDPKFSRADAVRGRVVGALATAYGKQHQCADGVFFWAQACTNAWNDPAFVRAIIARTANSKTPFEKFMIAISGFRTEKLKRGLGLLYLVRGDFAQAAQVFQEPGVESTSLGTDPFVIHIRDCHDCDHAAYGTAKWTHALFVKRMNELHQRATGADSNPEVAAAAAFDLANGLYNITSFGNARFVLEGAMVEAEPSAAEAWYKRAYEKTGNRELKAKAAFMAAKSEMARLIGVPDSSAEPMEKLPLPLTWFPVVKTFADTAYYKEILSECGHYRRWAAKSAQTRKSSKP